MKYLFLILIFLSSTLLGQSLVIEGNVVDGENEKPLVGVNITVSNSTKGTSTNEEGKFSFAGEFDKEQSLIFSILGYAKNSITIREFLKSDKIVKLNKSVIGLNKTVVVEGLIAKEGETPASFAKITRKEIENDYTLQDVPEYLSYLPSTTFYSENGNGIGYNYLSIRGFGQRRS